MNLAIVIVNWNTAALLRSCLHHLQAQEDGSSRIIVVDNGSTDGSAKMVAAEFPRVRLLRNEANLGFAAANNQGIRLALAGGAPYVALLNSDTEATPAAMIALAAFLAQNPGVGAVGPRLVRADGAPQPYGFGSDPTLPYLFARALRQAIFHRPMHDWAEVGVRQVDWVSGACLVARREALEAIGLLDEAIFMYFEDNDWCLRVRRAGWRVMHDPRVTVVHLGGQSLRRARRRGRPTIAACGTSMPSTTALWRGAACRSSWRCTGGDSRLELLAGNSVFSEYHARRP